VALPLAVTLGLLAADLAVTAPQSVARSLSTALVATAMETTVGMAFLVSGWVVMSRFTRTRSLADLSLATSLCLVGGAAVVALVYTVVPSLDDAGVSRVVPMVDRLIGAVLLAVSPHVPDVPVRRPRTAATAGLTVAAFVVATFAVGVGASLLWAPAGGHHEPTAFALRGPAGVQLVAGALLLAAAWGFAGRRGAADDPLALWFALGAFLLATSRIEAAIPLTAPELSSPGVLLRLAGAFAFLVGAAREVQSYQRQLRRAAIREERHRVARELHDGVAQDLVHVVSQARWLAGRYDEPVLREIAAASERALEDSRSAIDNLRHDAPGSVRAAVATAAESAAAQAGLQLDLTLTDVPPPCDEASRDLARIVAEAIRNAARHGAAERIHVRLETEEGRSILRVSDDGRGFDVRRDITAAGRGHWGLVTMRERAVALGGDFEVSSSPGGGTTIEVRLP
jgi:signal transduction histidine kinase